MQRILNFLRRALFFRQAKLDSSLLTTQAKPKLYYLFSITYSPLPILHFCLKLELNTKTKGLHFYSVFKFSIFFRN